METPVSTPKKPEAADLKTFRAAYEILQKHAHELRTQTEPNIDNLLDLVNESVQAYKVCKTRIDAVEKALQEALDDPELSDLMEEGGGVTADSGADSDADGISARSDGGQAPEETSSLPDLDDDIPF